MAKHFPCVFVTAGYPSAAGGVAYGECLSLGAAAEALTLVLCLMSGGKTFIHT
jgi:hypothetical protein